VECADPIKNPKKWDAPGGQLKVSGRRARTRFEGDQVMRVAPSRDVWKQLDGLFRFGVAGHLGDEELLGRFVGAGNLDRDESAEAAFAALVERYGPMVLGVCRRVLGDRHEAEDAFQAVFLVLARKAASIARRQQLANWLYGVACRTALDARARTTRRQARERKAHAMSPSEVNPTDEVDLDELRSILDEELARLPEKYRGAVVLCELDGLSRHAAAQRLGIPEGTLSSRLARARDLLRERLARRGLAPSSITLNAALAPEARALLIPPALAGSTIEAATRVAAGASLTEAASTSVATLTQGVLKAMFIAKFKGLVLGITAAVMTTGVVLAQYSTSSDPTTDQRLSVLEKKLDRILEALGGSSRTATKTEATPVGAGGTQAALPSLPTIAPSAPTAAHSATALPAPAGGAPGADTAPTALPALAEGLPSADAAPATTPAVATTVPAASSDGRPQTLATRVGALEERLAMLERRFVEMERRVSQINRPVGGMMGMGRVGGGMIGGGQAAGAMGGGMMGGGQAAGAMGGGMMRMMGGRMSVMPSDSSATVGPRREGHRSSAGGAGVNSSTSSESVPTPRSNP
jgi:RNA polymerase sigma factor (sigma-70 family)